MLDFFYKFTKLFSSAAINALCTREDNYMLLSGDDEGTIKLWDLRKKSVCFEWKENEDFISSFAIHEGSNLALAAG